MSTRRERAIDLANKISYLRDELAKAEAELAALMVDRHTRPSIEMEAVPAPDSQSRIRAVAGVGR